CNLQDVSHFTAFFIIAGAKTSVAEPIQPYSHRTIGNDPFAGSPTETLL
ncbi:unnamed protein product, partial [Choristocarpus tenellus]